MARVSCHFVAERTGAFACTSRGPWCQLRPSECALAPQLQVTLRVLPLRRVDIRVLCPPESSECASPNPEVKPMQSPALRWLEGSPAAEGYRAREHDVTVEIDAVARI